MTRYSARTALRHEFFNDLTNNNFSYKSNSSHALNICTPVNNQYQDSIGSNTKESKEISIIGNASLLNKNRLKNISKVTPPSENDLNSNNRSSFQSDNNTNQNSNVHVGIDKENCNNIITEEDSSIYIKKSNSLDEWDDNKDSIWIKETSVNLPPKCNVVTEDNCIAIKDKRLSNRKRKNCNGALTIDIVNTNLIDNDVTNDNVVSSDNRRRSKRISK